MHPSRLPRWAKTRPAGRPILDAPAHEFKTPYFTALMVNRLLNRAQVRARETDAERQESARVSRAVSSARDIWSGGSGVSGTASQNIQERAEPGRVPSGFERPGRNAVVRKERSLWSMLRCLPYTSTGDAFTFGLSAACGSAKAECRR